MTSPECTPIPDDVVIPLDVGGQVRVITADRETHGLVYVSFEGTRTPDVDGVASLDDDAVRALIAALTEGV